jgi:hypothetical protein
MAFNTSFVQNMFCDLEMQLYGKEIRKLAVEEPIFITALPRAGTTVLLEVLAQHPDTMTHSYRDMPFVLSPKIWRHLFGRFRVDLQKRERSHADGLAIDADSPEAFEEVLWLKQFPEMFGDLGIRLSESDGKRVRAYFNDMIRRLAASRATDTDHPLRYVSKNNANIARVASLKGAFPRAKIIVPLRAPLDHAISMHRQHLRYLTIHKESQFTRNYMRDIGHFEFGELHRPILFDGMESVIEEHDPNQLDYWLAYWLCAYGQLADQAATAFIDMAGLTTKPDLRTLLNALDLCEDETTIGAAEQLIRPITTYEPQSIVSDVLLDRARSLYDKIQTTRCL